MNILCVLPMTSEQKAALRTAAGTESDIVYTMVKEVTREQVRAAEIIIGNVPAGMIGQSERLKLLQLNSAGTDAYIVPGVLDSGTVLCNATGAYGKAVSEHMLALLLMLIKKLDLYRDNQNERVWRCEGSIRSIGDLTVVVVGLGDIGLYFARLCGALGAHTIGVKRRVGGQTEGVDEVVLTDRLYDVLPRADAVVSFLPNTEATRGVFGARAFAAMKDTAVFLNGGRGNAVVTEELCDALENGVIAGAGLDVTDPEPLPADHRLWGLRNAMLTPHVAGGFHLDETLERIIALATRNVEAVVNGRVPENIVDMKTGYRK